MKFSLKVGALAGALLIASSFTGAYGGSSAFSEAFADSTLRVDFTFSGDCAGDVPPSIAFSSLSRYKGWGGRRVNLDNQLREGAADVTVTTMSGDTIYSNPFCTLFQEWLVSEDFSGPKAMEGTVLVPFPQDSVNINISLRDNRRAAVAKASLRVDPDDILIADHTSGVPLPHNYVYRGDNPDSAKICVAFLAEGYTADEMSDFHRHAREAVDAILDHEPFASLADSFDFIAIDTPSAQSGVSVPAKGIWLDTAFGSHFSTFYSDRYLTTSNVRKLYDAITSTPAQHLIVLANTEEYGGGGIFNFYTLTAAKNKMFREVVVHEFGHSFAALADEYFYDNDIMQDTYPLDVEPWEPNITTKVDFSSKWQKLIDEGKADLVEGGGYLSKGIWRGTNDCRMRTNKAPEFCPVCQEAIAEIIKWYTIPLQSSAK